MTEFACECPLAGYCQRHGIRKTKREHEWCQGGADMSPAKRAAFIKKWEGGAAGAIAGTKTCVGCGAKKSKTYNGKPGTELKRLLSWFGQYATTGCGCVKHANVMDQRGCDWCEQNIETIVGWLKEEASQRSVLGFSLDRVPGFEIGAHALVQQAIKKARELAIHERMSRTSNPALLGFPIEPYRSTSHIIYHVMPLAGPSEWIWRQHVQWLREVRPQFNGRLVVGIVTKSPEDPWEYNTPEEVMQAFEGMGAEFIVEQNHFGKKIRTGRGEGVTFLKMLEKLETDDPNAIVYYGHTKGVTHPGEPVDSPVRNWTKISFDALFREQDIVHTALSSHGCVGSFRVRGADRVKHPGGWHFSGTFFAVRAAEVFRRDWRKLKNHYGCVELWVNGVFKEHESACVFFDNISHSRMLYQADFWKSTVKPRYLNWLNGGQIEDRSLTVATVLHNPAPSVVANINHIFASIRSRRNCQIVVVDNSTKKTPGVHADLHIWNEGRNNHWGGAINQAVAAATGELFIHFSARRAKLVDDRWIDKILAPLALESCGMAGPLQKVPFDLIGEKNPIAGSPEMHIQQAVFAARTEVLRRVPWGTKYPHTYSDVWHSWSLLKHGYNLVDVYEVTSGAGLEKVKEGRWFVCGDKL